MGWYVYAAYFCGGLFFGNSIPHLVNGISGRAFQTPFASPPGRGESSSVTNVLWGLFNLLAGYLLVFRVGSFELHNVAHALCFGAGMGTISVLMAQHFGQFHGGTKPPRRD
jgi:hypothetical protein